MAEQVPDVHLPSQTKQCPSSEGNNKWNTGRELHADILDFVSENITNWKRMARRLYVKDGIIDQIERDTEGVYEKAYKCLQAWLHARDISTGPLEELQKALIEIGRKDIAEEIGSMNFKLERVVLAREECSSVHMAMMSNRMSDLYGDQIEDSRNVDLMMSQLTVRCAEVDSARINMSGEIPGHLAHNLKAVAIEDVFRSDKMALIRGLPGSGKTTLCHFILREWHAGRLWKDRYNFIFYVNAPIVMSLFFAGRSSEDEVLNALYPEVFRFISFDELRQFNCLVLIDSIDEVDVENVCSRCKSSLAENYIKCLITSRKKFERIILGRPRACDEVRQKLLKDVSFQYIEVVGFCAKGLKEYVELFFSENKAKAEESWSRIAENPSLYIMVQQPVFANIVCNIFKQDSNVETMTEVCVYAYATFLSRHVTGRAAEHIDLNTFKGMFCHEGLAETLAKLSELAFQNLSSGKNCFEPSSDISFTDLDWTLISSFVYRRQEFFYFPNVALMEFLAAIHMFIYRERFTDAKSLESKYLRGVLPIFFGLLGGLVDNSDSPRIVCLFVNSLLKKFPNQAIDKHPLSGKLGQDIYGTDNYHDLYISLLFEFRNARLLSYSNIYWEDRARLCVRRHNQFESLFYLMEHFIHRRGQNIYLQIEPNDGRISLGEASELCRCIVALGCKVTLIILANFSVSGELMKLVSSCLCFIEEVTLRAIQRRSADCWAGFLENVKQARENGYLKLQSLEMINCQFIPGNGDEIKQLGHDCNAISMNGIDADDRMFEDELRKLGITVESYVR